MGGLRGDEDSRTGPAACIHPALARDERVCSIPGSNHTHVTQPEMVPSLDPGPQPGPCRSY